MNQLTSKSQYEADELFATLDATTKSIHLTGNLQVTLTDTVGFIQDLPTELVSSFKSTLEESKNVDLLVHVIDASDPNHEEHEKDGTFDHEGPGYAGDSSLDALQQSR